MYPTLKFLLTMSNEVLTHLAIHRFVNTLANIIIVPQATVPTSFDVINQSCDIPCVGEIVPIFHLKSIYICEVNAMLFLVRGVLNAPIGALLDYIEVDWEPPISQDGRGPSALALVQ